MPLLLFSLIILLFPFKELLPYDSEKIIIGCIFTFLLVSYVASNKTVYHSLISKSINLAEEYNNLISTSQQTQNKNCFFSITFPVFK